MHSLAQVQCLMRIRFPSNELKQMKTSVIALTVLAGLTGAVMTNNPAAIITETPFDLQAVQNALKETGSDTDEGSLVYESALPPSSSQLGALNSGTALSFLSLSPASPDLTDPPDVAPQSSSLAYLLAASFDPSTAGSGKIWAISATAPSDGHVLLAGLAQDVGLCFDQGHDYLYVHDRKEDGVSRIYQYKTTRADEHFAIQTAEYVVVYEGYLVSACTVDAFGNLYFSVSDTDVSLIGFVNYLDLWSGLKNEFVTLYSGPDELVQSPTDLATSPDLYLFWVNEDGEVVRAPGRYVLGKSPEVVSSSTLSLAVSTTTVFLASTNGSISVLNSTETQPQEDVGSPRAMCTAEEQVYVADTDTGKLLAYSTETVIAIVTGLSDVACVTAWGALRVFCGAILLLAIA